MIAQDHGRPPDPLFKLIWKWKGMERIKLFLWLMANDALHTNDFRVCSHVANSPYCTRYDEDLHEFYSACSQRLSSLGEFLASIGE